LEGTYLGWSSAGSYKVIVACANNRFYTLFLWVFLPMSHIYKEHTFGGPLGLDGVWGHWVQCKVMHLYIFGKVEYFSFFEILLLTRI
jgi:hypothetical protein